MDRDANRIVCVGGVAALVILGASPARAQTTEDPAPAQPVCTRGGRIHRMFHHVSHTAVDKFVGYPNTFIEPPLGYYAVEQFSVQVAKANTHRFTFYRSDFLPGTCQFSPAGASRFYIMTARVPAWMGPITVEWTPEEPALAEQRRAAVAETMARVGWPVLADRVVIGPSPYPGAMGVEAVNNFGNTVLRGQAAAAALPLPPVESAATGVH